MASRELKRLLEAAIVVAALLLAVLPLPLARPYLALIDPAHGVASSAKLAEPRTARIVVPDVPGSALVVFDGWGIPHIYATTDEAAFYALGWVEASLRLFQMDVYRRIPEGRLAELIGPKGLASDRVVVKLGLPGVIRAQASSSLRNPSLAPMNRLVKYFILGINDYIDYIRSKRLLPLEYRLLGREPDKWNYTDVYAVSKLPAILYSLTDTDLLMERILEALGPQALMRLGVEGRPPYSASCNETSKWSPGPQPLSPPTQAGEPPNPSSVIEELEAMRSVLAMFTGGIPASSSFVLNPAFTAGHKPVLALDLHGYLSAPPMWMIVHVVAPTITVAGILLPGTPFIYSGMNGFIAWSLTASRADQVDFYYYKWDGEGRYFFNGTWRKPLMNSVRLPVWDPANHRTGYVVVETARTAQGPLLGVGNESYAVAWTGLYKSNELAMLWMLNTARSVHDALRAQLAAGTPLYDLLVIDGGGHFALSPVGLLPIRSNTPSIGAGGGVLVNWGFLPFNASAGEGLWEGFIPKPSLRVVLDPKRPFLAVAGNPPFGGPCRFPGGVIHYGYNYETHFKAERLVHLLYQATSKPLGATVGDAWGILQDARDMLLHNLTTALIELASRVQGRLSPLEEDLLGDLAYWNGTTRAGYRASIALVWSTLFLEKFWSRVASLNVTAYPSAIGLLGDYTVAILRAYMAGEDWLAGAIPRGLPEEIAAETLDDTIKLLEGYYGTSDYREWSYGVLHYYQPTSPLGPLLPGLRLPRKPAAGGLSSLLTALSPAITSNRGARVSIGSTARLVCDLGGQRLLASIPGGESGNPFSAHYSDIYNLWASGGYVELSLTASPGSIQAEARLYINAWGEG